jgi:hypothetical protein
MEVLNDNATIENTSPESVKQRTQELTNEDKFRVLRVRIMRKLHPDSRSMILAQERNESAVGKVISMVSESKYSRDLYSKYLQIAGLLSLLDHESTHDATLGQIYSILMSSEEGGGLEPEPQKSQPANPEIYYTTINSLLVELQQFITRNNSFSTVATNYRPLLDIFSNSLSLGGYVSQESFKLISLKVNSVQLQLQSFDNSKDSIVEPKNALYSIQTSIVDIIIYIAKVGDGVLNLDPQQVLQLDQMQLSTSWGNQY